MRLETGKFYKDGHGNKGGPAIYAPDYDGDKYDWIVAPLGCFKENGESMYEAREHDLTAEWTEEPDIFTVGEEYTSKNGVKWACIAKESNLAWLRKDPPQPDLEYAYAWNLDGAAISLRHIGKRGDYYINKNPVVEDVTMYRTTDGRFELFYDYRNPHCTHRINFTVTDGEPDCGSIKMEPIEKETGETQ